MCLKARGYGSGSGRGERALLSPPIAMGGLNATGGLNVLHAAELAFEVGAAEEEGGGAAVGAVVGFVGEAALLQQGGDFFGRQTVAGTDGGVAGHQAEQVVEEHFTIGQMFLGRQMIDDCAQ